MSVTEIYAAAQWLNTRQITRSDYDRFDRIYVMDRMNLRLIRGILGQERMDKVSMLLDHDIADSWYTDNFQTTYTDLLQGLTAIINNRPA